MTIMRRCSNCGGTTEPGFATDTYTREGSDLEITVSGIPAEVCPACSWNYTDIDTAQQVAELVEPLFRKMHTLKLPPPKISISFPAAAVARD